jgi:CTP synthase
MTKYIVITGGVISGVGKGVTTASLGKILKEYGFATTLIKIDPYINYDAGTLRPTEHGEVWVTDDGGEIDQDLGTYERFMDTDIPKHNNMTTGQIYQTVITKERHGEYLGKTVQFIPHVPDEIIRRVKQAASGYEIAIIEIGGTVGDYENGPFLCAMTALERELGADSMAYVLVSYLPIPTHTQEMKTKPTQQAIKMLREEGIMPDFIVCRAEHALDEARKKKIEVYANMDSNHVLSAPDVQTIYQVPLDLEAEQFGEKVLATLKLTPKKKPDWTSWSLLVDRIKRPKTELKIAVVGKYVASGNYSIADSYFSIGQAAIHAGAALDVKAEIEWIDAQQFEDNPARIHDLKNYAGVIVAGGFGASGVRGKLSVIEYVRMHNIPYMGLCYGMQLACVEFARNVCNLPGAHTTEVDPATSHPIIDLLPTQKQKLAEQEYGATMRVGSFPAQLIENSQIYKLYATTGRLSQDKEKITAYEQRTGQKIDHTVPIVFERHRHRYEVNSHYVAQLEKNGLLFSGFFEREDGTRLMEMLELPEHPFFVATQAHGEFTSRLGNPNPLFYGFIKAATHRYDEVNVHVPIVRTHYAEQNFL